MTVLKKEMFSVLIQCAILAIIGWAMGIYFWSDLPEPMPVHWDASGQPDGFAPRWLGISVGPLTSLIVPLFILICARLDPKRGNVERSQKYLDAILLGTAAFGLAIQGVVLHAALGEGMALDTGLLLYVVGALFMILGNALPKFGSNYFVGIRTPWTLSSEAVWARTQRLGGILFVLAGLAIMILPSLGLSGTHMIIATLALTFGAALAPAIYSFFIWKDEARE